MRTLSERWARATRALRKDDQVYGERLVTMVRQHSSEGFCAFDDPLESAMFSILVEMMKRSELGNVDP